ncbi:MAG: ABC transporter substrate-binding protein, partial [Rhodospirillaceae bacterium]
VLAGDKFLQEKKIVKIITPAAGSASMTQWVNPPVDDLYMFRFAAADNIQSAMVVEEAILLKFNKVAVLHDATNYGVSGRDDLTRRITADGKLAIVATEKFNIGDKDMSAQLLRAKASGAQAVLIWGIGPELAAVANDMAKIGFKVPLIGGWTLSMSNFINNAGANGDGALMPQTFIEEPVTKAAASFIEAYHKAYAVARIPSPVSAAQGYDAVLLLAAAVKQAGSTDPQKIRDALEDLREPVNGVIATWKKPYSKWDAAHPETHEAFRRENVVMGMVNGGRVVFANPDDRARLEKR